MSIEDIKSKLSIEVVLRHYGLAANQNRMLRCPFHDDKKASMRVYPETDTVYCFAGNSCEVDSLDAIDFIMRMDKSSKHEALLKAKRMIGGDYNGSTSKRSKATSDFRRYTAALKKHQAALAYCDSRCLDVNDVEMGYKSRKTADKWGRGCLIFPLRDETGKVVSLYGRAIKGSGHYYQSGRSGLYPHYPQAATKKLILTEAVIDAASLVQYAPIATEYEVLALYGINGLTVAHEKAIGKLEHLEEIIWFVDGDAAGRSAITTYSPVLAQLQPQAVISAVATPEGEDVNSLLQGHSEEIFYYFLSRREGVTMDNATAKVAPKVVSKKLSTTEKAVVPVDVTADQLDTTDPTNLKYVGSSAHYYIKGGLKSSLDSLKVSLQIVHPQNSSDYRSKIDLYEYKQMESLIKRVTEELKLDGAGLKRDLSRLVRLLEQHRRKVLLEKKVVSKKIVAVPKDKMSSCLDFLKAPHLMKRLNQLIGGCGITGEQRNRLFLFCIALSYKMPDTLHALIQGSSGSGKSRLLKTICGLMPNEDVICFTRVTESSFYNYPENFLVHKLIGLEDMDGLKEEAQLAIRELISNEKLVSSTSSKTESGQIVAMAKTVRGPIASIACTTKGEIYEDNMSRVFLIAVDESKEQTMRIIEYQQGIAAGLINRKAEQQNTEFLQNIVRLLAPQEVVNPFARKIKLPQAAHKIRRLNELYLSLVKQVTLIHQYQRKRDDKGRLISSVTDLQMANEIMFESIVLKVDELDGSLRQFFEQLKAWLKKMQSEEFILRQIRQALTISRSRLHRYMTDLIELEYVQIIGGHANRGYQYKISYWDDIAAVRAKIKQDLQQQIDSLKPQT